MIFNLQLKSVFASKHTNLPLKEDWKHRLYTPTVIERYGNHVFIVDCWHHRVIYSRFINAPIKRWNTLISPIGTPHSIASDGEVFLTEDSVRSKIFVFKHQKGNKYVQTQEINGVGQRPHRIIYDNKTRCFYGISANSGELFVLNNCGGAIEKIALYQIDSLMNCYTRSLRIMDEKLYIVSGPGRILQLCPHKLKRGELQIEAEYQVPFELYTMNDIMHIGNYYYISSYQDGNGSVAPRMVRVKNLDDLIHHKYENIYDEMGLKGVPYYFSFIDDRIYLTEIDKYTRIRSFCIENDKIVDIRTHFDFGAATNSSEQRHQLGETQELFLHL